MVARRTRSGSGGSAQLLHGAATVVVGRRRRRSCGDAVQATKQWPGASEVCGMVGAVRQRCAGQWRRAALVVEKGRCGAVQATKCWSGASEVCGMVGAVRRRCGGQWELCGTVALVVGEDEGWPEMVKLAEKSEKRSLHNEEIGVF
ncbi:hypothetical protein DEO72_LG3g137 [Vigna unguiculata]|uniref:Uncharacterized protein n=1 Tax=Vigna unguiculata TaxID=3917 RepID=A0A4D6LAQ0_VIGUN|nr:hypothetical protein DEO72_LG3g137 [Vigna unguiculata]